MQATIHQAIADVSAPGRLPRVIYHRDAGRVFVWSEEDQLYTARGVDLVAPAWLVRWTWAARWRAATADEIEAEGLG